MALWLVTDCDAKRPGSVADAVFIEADSPADAAGQGMWALWDEWVARDSGGGSNVEAPHCCYVLIKGKPVRFRATLSAERVPDNYQCCGGMPTYTLGTLDQHTAICTLHPNADPS